MWGGPVTRFPSLTVARFPVHVGEYPITRFPSLTVMKKSHCTFGGTLLQGSCHWQLQGSQYMWEDPITRFPSLTVMKKITSYMGGNPVTRFLSLTVTRFPHSHHIVHVGVPHYKVTAFHIRFMGDHKSHWQLQGSRSGVSLLPRTGGFNCYTVFYLTLNVTRQMALDHFSTAAYNSTYCLLLQS